MAGCLTCHGYSPVSSLLLSVPVRLRPPGDLRRRQHVGAFLRRASLECPARIFRPARTLAGARLRRRDNRRGSSFRLPVVRNPSGRGPPPGFCRFLQIAAWTASRSSFLCASNSSRCHNPCSRRNSAVTFRARATRTATGRLARLSSPLRWPLRRWPSPSGVVGAAKGASLPQSNSDSTVSSGQRCGFSHSSD